MIGWGLLAYLLDTPPAGPPGPAGPTGPPLSSTGEGIVAAVTAVAVTIGLVTQVILQLLTRLEARRVARQAAVSAAAAASKLTHLASSNAAQDVRLEGLATVAAATHTLVRSQMVEQLERTAQALRRVANLTRLEEDEEAAQQAERAQKEYAAAQDPAPG